MNTNQDNMWGSPAPTLTLLFSMISLVFVGMFFGLIGPNATLLLAVLQLGIFPAYFAGALIFLKNKDFLSGNVFLIFATFFGIVPGLTNLALFIAGLNGWVLDSSILGWEWMILALTLLFIVPAFAKAPKVFFCLYLSACIALVIVALGYFGILSPAVFSLYGGILLAIVGVLGIYSVVSAFLAGVGIMLPQGKPFFK